MARITDGPVVAARRRFTDAVHALADPQPSWVDGTCHWTPAVYTRLRRALRGQPVSSRQVPQSRLPCHAGVLALLVEIDDGVAGWLREGFGTPDKLGRLRDRTWRPQDCGLLEARAADLRRWTVAAAELLRDTAPEVALRLPCPSCGRRFVYRLSHGENVRSWALRVSENGARCLGCDASWATDKFEFLARLLGLPALQT